MPSSQIYNSQNFLSAESGQITAGIKIIPTDDSVKNDPSIQQVDGESSDDSSNSSLATTPLGTSGQAGESVSTFSTNDKPNVFLNFKEKSFSNRGLIFRFKTSNLGSVGTTASSWSSDSNVSNITLSADSGSPLKIVEAYGKKFYELSSNFEIKNNSVALTPSIFPSYTILVFALGRTDNADVETMLKDSSSIHKFVENRIVPIDVPNINPQTNKFYNFFQFNNGYYSNFNGSTLHTIKYGPVNDSSNSLSMFSLLNLPRFGYNNVDLLAWSSGGKFFKPVYHNLFDLRTNLNTPASGGNFTIDDGSTVNFNRFTLFFVQMHTTLTNKVDTYTLIRGQPNSVKVVENETFINRQQISYLKQWFFPTFNLDGSLNYVISLSNKNNTASAGSTRMFLLDYMHGTESTKEKRDETSNNIIESLAYDYRSLLLKSLGDLQISDSQNSLQFPVPLAHPFVNLYSSSSSS